MTRVVLSGVGVTRHTDGTYHPTDTGEEPTDAAAVIRGIVRQLNGIALTFAAPGSRAQPTYEDIFFLAQQIADSEEGELDNPAARMLTERLALVCAEQLTEAAAHGLAGMAGLCREATRYIHDVTWRMLARPASSVTHLQAILRLCEDPRFARVTVATLNHDSSLDRCLVERGLAHVDGFSASEGGVRYWNPELFWADPPSIDLLKLHGSVDWFRFRPDHGDPYDDRIGIAVDGDHEHSVGSGGRRQHPLDWRPMILIGTFNKIADYSQPMFAELHYQLRRRLTCASRLIVCGYGFGDKGINSIVVEWLHGERGRRLVVVHGDPSGLRAHARGAIDNRWDTWMRDGVLLVVEKWIQALEPDELIELAG